MINFCDCKDDGFCSRYQREMRGRFREICQGVNVDLGTAAAFREQWSREASGLRDGIISPRTYKVDSGERKQLLLKTDQAPGDSVAMTAAIYSLHRSHPSKYVTAVESYWPEVFAYNPDVAYHTLPGGTLPDLTDSLQMHYPAVHQSNERGIHFMQGWCEFLGMALGINVPLLTNRPRIYFAGSAPPVEDFWLVCSGGKRDFTNKLWGHDKYQEVVSSLKEVVRFIQVGGGKPPVPWRSNTAGSQEDDHSRLDGTYDMVGKTTLRDLFDLTRRARGVLCGVSLLMHVAAALEKPAIVVAGGREPVPWNAYPKQQYVHTVGALPCSDTQGQVGGACWRSRVVPLGDGTIHDKDTCLRPVSKIPECMTLIRPAYVAELVSMYNQQYRSET